MAGRKARSACAAGAVAACMAFGGAHAAPSGESGAAEGARPGGAPSVAVTLSPREIRVGDLVEAKLGVEVDAGAGRPAFPNWQRHWGEAEIREVGETIREDGAEAGSVRWVQTLVLTSFRPGVVALPPATIVIPNGAPGAGTESPGLEISTDASSFEVGSVLPAGEEQLEPRPPAPPVPLPVGERFWWSLALLALLALGLAGLLLARRPGEDVYAGESIDPWDALEAALARLAAAADAEAAFTGLSLELRRYLGRTLAFPAAESTTTELRRRLLRSGLPSSVCSDVVRLLLEADTVKFARKEPAAGRIAECLEQARAAAADIRRFAQPAEPPEKGEAAA